MQVIFLTRDKLTLYQVNLSGIPTSTPVGEAPYTIDNFLDTFSQIKPKLNGELRLVLGNELSYVVNLSVPATESDERGYIRAKLPELFPDTFGQNDWDFCQTGTTEDQKDMVVFASVKPYKELIDQLSSLGIKIISVEPESVAITRHPDPVVGTALKKDLVGADDKVLNLAPAPTSHFNWNWILVPLFLILFISGNIYLFLTLKQRQSTKKAVALPSPIPTIALPTTIPTPTVVALKIKVLNGTGVPGAAATLADNIRALGYSNITTGNTSPTFTQSAVIFKNDDIKETLYNSSQKLIKIAASKVTIDNQADFDAIFIIGKN